MSTTRRIGFVFGAVLAVAYGSWGSPIAGATLDQVGPEPGQLVSAQIRPINISIAQIFAGSAP